MAVAAPLYFMHRLFALAPLRTVLAVTVGTPVLILRVNPHKHDMPKWLFRTDVFIFDLKIWFLCKIKAQIAKNLTTGLAVIYNYAPNSTRAERSDKPWVKQRKKRL